MKYLLITLGVFFLASCAAQDSKNTHLTDFVLQDESGQFGYRTAWSRVINQPIQHGEPESARDDFEQCNVEIQQDYIKGLAPSNEIKLSFLVECMSEKGWYWRAVPYGYVSSL